jgi:hypothetical protein
VGFFSFSTVLLPDSTIPLPTPCSSPSLFFFAVACFPFSHWCRSRTQIFLVLLFARYATIWLPGFSFRIWGDRFSHGPCFFLPFVFPNFFSLFVARSMRVICPRPFFTARFLILVLCAMIPWLVCLLFFSLGLRIHPPLYSPVYNPCPLRDDSLDLSVDFFSGFMDSLLELGDLFVVFCFPIRSIGESSVFHMPVWSCYPFKGHRCSLSLQTLYLLQSLFKLIW